MYYIGIDGGGTKTEAVLADKNLNVLKRIVLEGSNPNDVGVDVSCRSISKCIDMLRFALPTEDDNVIAFAGIAGIKNHKTEMEAYLLRKYPFLTLESDALLPLISEFGANDGVVMICGTGSACFARKDGVIYRIGGWGYLIDGGGSGFNIGREVLEGAFRYSDGRDGSAFIFKRITEKYPDMDVSLLNEIYEKGKPFIASFSPIAFEGAELGDEYCIKIIDSLISYLAECIAASQKKLGEGFHTVITGGIAATHPEICTELYRRTGVRVALASSRPIFGALIGAVLKTDKSYGSRIEELRINFNKSYKASATE